MTNTLAKIISRVFGPLTIEPVLFVLMVLFMADLAVTDRVAVGAILVVTNLFIPGVALVWAYVSGWISDLDITKRQERVTVFSIAMVSVWVGLISIILLRISAPIFYHLLLAQVVVLTILWALTFFEKVSLHAAGITSITATVIVILGWAYWPLILCIPLVCWARWYLKKHTLRQLALGVLIPVVVYLFVMLVLSGDAKL